MTPNQPESQKKVRDRYLMTYETKPGVSDPTQRTFSSMKRAVTATPKIEPVKEVTKQ